MRGAVTRRACFVAAGWLVLLAAPAARAQFPDTLGAWTPTSSGSQFDIVPRADYLRAHAASLDNYLEYAPGGVLARMGPIGSVSAYSRWGIGRGRATLTFNGVPFNNPENGVAPWVDIATSAMGTLWYDARAWTPSWIEGNLDLVTAPPSDSQPTTYVELSKGNNDLRQRRVHFGSEAGRIGLDLAYDEVLDDGYAFDAAGNVPYGPEYGKARSRHNAITLRGSPDERASFSFGFRQFESSTTGNLTSATAEGDRSGHLAWLEASAGATRITVFGRGFTTSAPDSECVNETTGASVESALGGDARGVRVRVTAQETAFTQHVGAGYTARLAGGSAVASARSQLAGSAELFAGGSAEGDEKSQLVWGAYAGARRVTPRQILSVQAGRTSRMPTLAERFLPEHVTDGRTLSGDNGVDPERAFELRGDWEQRGGVLVNRVRASWISAEKAIAFRPRDVGGETWRVAGNGSGTQTMFFGEDRVRGEFTMGPLRALAEGGVLISSGDRAEAFASVPDVQGTASFLIGGEMFQATSAIYLGGEYVHMGTRDDYDGRELPAFNVLNLSVNARLIDVHFYLRYLNVLDEQYATVDGYLMTPRTFVYGLEWTLYN